MTTDKETPPLIPDPATVRRKLAETVKEARLLRSLLRISIKASAHPAESVALSTDGNKLEGRQ